LQSKEFSDEAIQKSGLFLKDSQTGNIISRFKNRVMFPVIDYQGRTVAFGGRILSDNKNIAKYVNSEESFFFNKRRILYALNQARPAIKEQGAVILMEGYMDVITAHQFGIKNAIATMGTAVTFEHAQKIQRFTSNVYMALDQDEAGQKAIEKSYSTLTQYNLQSKIIHFGSKDPAEALIQFGKDHFLKAIEESQSIVDFKFNRLLNTYDISKVENISPILDEILPLLRIEKDNIIQRHYVGIFASKLNIEEELIMAKLKKKRYNIATWVRKDYSDKKSKYVKAEEHLIYLIASNLEIKAKILGSITPKDFITDDYRVIVEDLTSRSLVNEQLLENLEDSDAKKSLGRILIEHDGLETYRKGGWEDHIRVLKEYGIEDQKKEILAQIKALEPEGREKEIEDLCLKYQALQQRTKSE
jgi:DNA primase